MPRSTTAAAPDMPDADAAPSGDVETQEQRRRVGTRGLNRVELIGRLARDPELRYTPAGTPVAALRIATNDTRVPEFHDVVVWNGAATYAGEYLRSGRLVWVAGRLRRNRWEAEDGYHERVEVIAFDLQGLDWRATADTAGDASEGAGDGA